MQYTGLKDKNGTEIYEGDILKVEETSHVVAWGEYDYPAFDIFPNIDVECNGLQWACLEGDAEVIGNIHQNLELVEVSS